MLKYLSFLSGLCAFAGEDDFPQRRKARQVKKLKIYNIFNY